MAEAKRKFRIHAALPALVAAFGLEGARAQIHQSDEIIVWGRQVNLIGDASSASEGLVGYADLSLRPLLRTGELVEVIPGMIATQHSGSGKANQYFLRGFNLDHGTDFAAFVDGAPANHRSHGHGHGYLDLNFIIPETVEYVAYRKGAYAADRGDFAIAGSSAIKTYDRFDTGFAQATVGLNEFIRVVGGASTPAFGGDVLIAGEAQVYDGPWELDEDLQRFSALAKYTRERDDDHFQLVLNGYTAEWTSTDQIPLRAVEDGFLVETENGLEEITLSRLGFIDPDLGGETTRISAAASYQTGDLDLSVYALYYDFELFSNFTYFLSDPLQGDEFEQFDRRWTFGGAATYSFEHEIGGLGEGAKLETRIGGDWRHDNIFDIGLYQTNARERIDLIRDDNLGITSGAAFIDTTMHWTPRLRMTLGARADYVAFTVRDAAIDDNEGGGDDIIFSPKASLAWRALDELEFYANYGEGFHSNDVRGVVIDIDPATLGPADRTPLLVKGRGGELGLRAAPAPGLNLTMAGFWVSLDSELVFVGDAGGSEPNEATRRFGFEAEAFWRPKDWLTLDASATAVNARFSDAAAGADRIPNAITNTLAAGVTVTTPDDFIATLRLRRFGPAPLIEDNSVRSDPTTTLNLRVAKAFGPMEISLDVLNLLDSKDNDITYFYESRLRFEGLPISAFGSSRATLAQSATARRATVSQPHTRLVGPPGIEDIHFHPLEPRTARLTLRANF